jgi:Uma2 family endonuclease
LEITPQPLIFVKKNEGMTENTIYMGVNAPKIHQRIIGQLMMQLGILYYTEKSIPYEPFPETMIDESQTSPTPDILLFDNAQKLNRVIIEVSGNTGARRDFEKVKQLVEEYGVQEGFVYNYDTRQWLKYALSSGEDLIRPSFSDEIGLDLNELLAGASS